MMKEFQEYWIYHKWENIDKVLWNPVI
jgi:hypothetical protein